ncbi:MAG: zinc-ribbon domain containing protein [Candidatus Chisholmbacteria bacterium]|nr:zinc-ribbon domain containing protein [Candidatus Chisholmbacteria bacterium]
MVDFQDKTLICENCGREFFWSAEEQEFYAQQVWSEPKWCPICSAKKRAERRQEKRTEEG